MSYNQLYYLLYYEKYSTYPPTKNGHHTRSTHGRSTPKNRPNRGYPLINQCKMFGYRSLITISRYDSYTVFTCILFGTRSPEIGTVICNALVIVIISLSRGSILNPISPRISIFEILFRLLVLAIFRNYFFENFSKKSSCYYFFFFDLIIFCRIDSGSN